MIARLFNGLFSVYFLVVAFLQLNDPDPWVWVPLYLTAFGLSLAVGKVPQVGLAAFGLVCAMTALWVGMSAQDWGWTLQSESLREVLGLLIVTLWTRWARRFPTGRLLWTGR